MTVRWGNKIQEYAFLYYMEVIRPIGTVDETIGGVCLRWSTVDEVDHSRRRGTRILEKEGLPVEGL